MARGVHGLKSKWYSVDVGCEGYGRKGIEVRDCGSMVVAAVALAVALFSLGMSSYLAVSTRGVTVEGPAMVMPMEVR